ncbi:MAG TPA: polysaccharide ABC transporter ATP-binding protein [Acidimicrobiales bacterium]|nr:polysaccharide ABC transporter ATP-binding protein [Acidimicrobiales bacterium]
MSDDVAIRFDQVGKMYKVFGSKLDTTLDALNLPSFRRRTRFREFWALRDIDLELPRGGRLGIIGRNGAGKTTLLKLVTGNVSPSEGRVTVNGNVQALLEIGGGLHPEFTGLENIRASLAYLGLSRSEIDDAEREIAEFTELGRFLEQPFKAYSQGMQARLSFAIATTVQPEILIVDEILGAGDAYFFTRSTARMSHLIEGGAGVLLVSHALEQVARFCDRTIWLERGRIAMDGPTDEVIKAYERFIRELEDRRIRAKNEKAARPQYDAFDRDTFTDAVVGSVSADGGSVDVARLTLWRDGAIEGEIDVGGAQDVDASGAGGLLLEDGGWDTPQTDAHGHFRTVSGRPGPFRFDLWFLYPQSSYEVEIVYRTYGGPVSLRLEGTGDSGMTVALRPADEWTSHRFELPRRSEELEASTGQGLSRWPGIEGLAIRRVQTVGEDNSERAVFRVHEPFSVVVEAVATVSGNFPLIAAALIYRLDGIAATRHVGKRELLRLEEGDRVVLRLDLGRLLLGNGTYLLSIGLYRELDVDNTYSATLYDLFDRSFEFVVTGNPPMHTEAFRHPGDWSTVVLPKEEQERELTER